MELTRYGNLMKLIGKEKYFSVRKSIALEALKEWNQTYGQEVFHVKNNCKTMDEALSNRRQCSTEEMDRTTLLIKPLLI